MIGESNFESKTEEAVEKAIYIMDVDDYVMKDLIIQLIENEPTDYIKDYVIGFFNDSGYGDW